MSEQRVPGYCPLCISRCGCISVVRDGVLQRVEPDPSHPTGAAICLKAKAAPELVNSPERLLYPLKRTRPKDDPDPGWQRIGWDEALDLIAGQMRAIAAENGPEAVAFSVTTPSGTAVADGMPWLFRLVHAFGSPNTLWTTHICNWHKDFAPHYTFGSDLGMPDFERTGCIVLWGFNPATCWLAQASAIERARKRGTKLVVVDPRRAGLAAKAEQWLAVRPGSDGALALSLAHVLIEQGWYDWEFIARWSNGPFLVREDSGALLREADIRAGGSSERYVVWDEKQAAPQAVASGETLGGGALFGQYQINGITCRPAFDLYSELCREHAPERAATLTGISAAQVRATARLLHEAGPVSFYAWSGVGQSSNATQTSRALALLYALLGHFDEAGGNLLYSKPPLNNVLGAELLAPGQRAKTLGYAERPLGPAKNGWITTREFYRAISTGKPYPVRALINFGANLLLSRPAAAQGEAALQKLDFYAHADLFLNPTAQYADVVLPVASPWERGGLQAGFMVDQTAEQLLQLRTPVVAPRGEAHADSWIAFELAKRLGLSGHFFEGDMEAGLRHVLAPSGVSLEALRAQPQGVRLPLEHRPGKYRATGFATPSGRVELYSESFRAAGQSPLPAFVAPPATSEEFPLRLTSAKWSQYCHSQQRQLPGLRRRMREPLVELHPQCAAVRDITEGDWVVVRSPHATMRARATFNNTLAPDVVCAQYGWWQNDNATNANYNALIDNKLCDPVSGSFLLRGTICQVERG